MLIFSRFYDFRVAYCCNVEGGNRYWLCNFTTSFYLYGWYEMVKSNCIFLIIWTLRPIFWSLYNQLPLSQAGYWAVHDSNWSISARRPSSFSRKFVLARRQQWPSSGFGPFSHRTTMFAINRSSFCSSQPLLPRPSDPPARRSLGASPMVFVSFHQFRTPCPTEPRTKAVVRRLNL